ncbi:phytoene/squalene synthase family protein [Salinispira pacifica]
MGATKIHEQTFKAGSRTYYSSSVFFPEAVRTDVHILYGFVRVADNFVDAVPQDAAGFHDFCARYRRALSGSPTGDLIIDSFVDLLHRKNFDPQWVDAFLHSMELDLTKRTYDSLQETLEYIYGSAEVIGLFMARLLSLPEESHYAARMLGRSMQYINFIRDIREDITLGRRYLPLTGTALGSLDAASAAADPWEFSRFIRREVDLYRSWQREAEQGYRFIPRRYLVPIKTASDMYGWTARRIERNPFIVFEKKVKPARYRILLAALGNSVGI